MTMELIEANPLPTVCRNCSDEFCDECEHMMERWFFSPEDQCRLERLAKEKAIARLQRESERLRD